MSDARTSYRTSTRTSSRLRSPRGSRLLILLALTVLLSGCQSMNPLPNFGVGQVSPEEIRIRNLMKWHSGRVEVYREFRTIFTARAVYLSEDIRRSVIEFESRSKLLSPDERRELEERLEGSKDSSRILLGFYTPSEKHNDLADDESIWTPYLEGLDGSVTRAACFGVGEEESKIYMRFLEWDLSWSKLYMLCFAFDTNVRKPDEGQIDLVISGSQGRGMIRLKTTPPGDVL